MLAVEAANHRSVANRTDILIQQSNTSHQSPTSRGNNMMLQQWKHSERTTSSDFVMECMGGGGKS